MGATGTTIAQNRTETWVAAFEGIPATLSGKNAISRPTSQLMAILRPATLVALAAYQLNHSITCFKSCLPTAGTQ
jgi:hypothetical protein